MEKKIKKLQEENKDLKRQLDLARKWMAKEVKSSLMSISKKRLKNMADEEKQDFVQGNHMNIISQQIQDFFSEIFLLNAPKNTIDHLVDAEVSYYNLQKNPTLDGFTVVSSYQKLLDACVEQMIVVDFRKFAKKNTDGILRTNDPLEKALFQVVDKKYILSLGRVYAIMKKYREDDLKHPFEKIFGQYIKKYSHIQKIFSNDSFFTLFEKLITSEIFGSKRHKGKINFQDTKKAREILVGNYSNTECLMYIFLELHACIY